MELHEDSLPVLIYTPYGRDSSHLAKILATANYRSVICAHIEDVIQKCADAGTLLITEEVLQSPQGQKLLQAFSEQPSWSALPVVAFYGGATSANPIEVKAVHPLQKFAELTVLRRPISASTLVSAVHAAIKDRTRQFEIKKLLEDRERLQQHALREKEKYEVAFDAVAEGIFIFDSKGEAVFMNDAAAKVFGENVAEDVRKNVHFFFERLQLYELDGTHIPISEWPVSKALRGDSFRDWQIRAHRTDTNQHWIWSSSGALAKQPGRDITLAVVVLRDITVEKNSEIELKAAKEEAERANQTKTFFLANMSHEIRTPLGAILGFTDLLKDKKISREEREQYLETISRNGKGLTRIIDDILDLAKVESGKLEIETIEFSIFNLVDEVLDLFRERTKSKGLFLRLQMAEDIPNNIISDPTRLRQILINLVGNAVKFTDQGGIFIKISAIPLDSKLCFSIEVRDTGIGISEEQRQRLFQPFTQADNTTTRKYGGTGLGLVLSQRLAKALGGKIAVDQNEDGFGSRFTVFFMAEVATPRLSPLQRPHAEAKILKNQAPLQNLLILVADDSDDNQRLATRILTREGAVVETADNGEIAYELALKKEFDVILMDMQMPKMDGYQATKALRDAGYKKPIVALTAHAMAEERAKTLAAGCDTHLTKPIDRKLMIEEILRVVREN